MQQGPQLPTPLRVLLTILVPAIVLIVLWLFFTHI